jgi:hypothetical protein
MATMLTAPAYAGAAAAARRAPARARAPAASLCLSSRPTLRGAALPAALPPRRKARDARRPHACDASATTQNAPLPRPLRRCKRLHQESA